MKIEKYQQLKEREDKALLNYERARTFLIQLADSYRLQCNYDLADNLEMAICLLDESIETLKNINGDYIDELSTGMSEYTNEVLGKCLSTVMKNLSNQ